MKTYARYVNSSQNST